MVTPIREVEYVAGVAMFGMLKLCIGVGLLAIGAFVFYSFDVSTLGFGVIPIAAVLLMVGWCISLLVIGIVLRFGTGAEAPRGVMFGALPLGVFYPVDAPPDGASRCPSRTDDARFRRAAVSWTGTPDWGWLGGPAAETVVLAVLVWYCRSSPLPSSRQHHQYT
jgi:ABC-2 type transport system permease protein